MDKIKRGLGFSFCVGVLGYKTTFEGSGRILRYRPNEMLHCCRPLRQKGALQTRGCVNVHACTNTTPLNPNHKLQTPNPEPQTPNPKPQTPNPKPQTPNPKPQTPNPKPQTPNPKPQTCAKLVANLNSSKLHVTINKNQTPSNTRATASLASCTAAAVEAMTIAASPSAE